MANQMIFKRMEIKFVVSDAIRDRIVSDMSHRMREDEHGASTIYSLYMDTDDYLLARRSMEHPLYKEKLRIRSYGQLGSEDEIFVEIKQKFKSVTTKRRLSLFYEGLDNLDGSRLYEILSERSDQVAKEMVYAFDRYKTLEPRILLTYDRCAYYDRDDYEFRVTFDRNIRYDEKYLRMDAPASGKRILDEGLNVMEVKTLGALPLWFVEILSSYGVYKASFSKYGMAFRDIYLNEGSPISFISNDEYEIAVAV